MSRIDRITIVDSGNGQGTGASKITQDISKVLAELPPVVEALSGLDLAELIQRLPELASGTGKQTAANKPEKPAKPTP